MDLNNEISSIKLSCFSNSPKEVFYTISKYKLPETNKILKLKIPY